MENNKKNINKKSYSRFFALQILYSYFQNNEENNILDLKQFIEDNYIISDVFNDKKDEYINDSDIKYLNNLIENIVKNLNAIDDFLKKNLIGKYTFNNIDELIKDIFRMAIYEFKWTNLEKKIIINEYVDIAAEYFDAKITSFVNATLDKLSKI